MFMSAWMDEQIIGFNRTQARGSKFEITVMRNVFNNDYFQTKVLTLQYLGLLRNWV